MPWVQLGRGKVHLCRKADDVMPPLLMAPEELFLLDVFMGVLEHPLSQARF